MMIRTFFKLMITILVITETAAQETDDATKKIFGLGSLFDQIIDLGGKAGGITPPSKTTAQETDDANSLVGSLFEQIIELGGKAGGITPPSKTTAQETDDANSLVGSLLEQFIDLGGKAGGITPPFADIVGSVLGLADTEEVPEKDSTQAVIQCATKLIPSGAKVTCRQIAGFGSCIVSAMNGIDLDPNSKRPNSGGPKLNHYKKQVMTAVNMQLFVYKAKCNIETITDQIFGDNDYDDDDDDDDGDEDSFSDDKVSDIASYTEMTKAMFQCMSIHGGLFNVKTLIDNKETTCADIAKIGVCAVQRIVKIGLPGDLLTSTILNTLTGAEDIACDKDILADLMKLEEKEPNAEDESVGLWVPPCAFPGSKNTKRTKQQTVREGTCSHLANDFVTCLASNMNSISSELVMDDINKRKQQVMKLNRMIELMSDSGGQKQCKPDLNKQIFGFRTGLTRAALHCTNTNKKMSLQQILQSIMKPCDQATSFGKCLIQQTKSIETDGLGSKQYNNMLMKDMQTYLEVNKLKCDMDTLLDRILNYGNNTAAPTLRPQSRTTTTKFTTITGGNGTVDALPIEGISTRSCVPMKKAIVLGFMTAVVLVY